MKGLKTSIFVAVVLPNLVKSASEICALPNEAESCNAITPRFYYDAQAEKCVQFDLGKCGGNANNFENEIDCQKACNPCQLPKAPWVDKIYDVLVERFWFNQKVGKCMKYIYTDEGSINDYNFQNRADCKALCEKPGVMSICTLSPNISSSRRCSRNRFYYYDAASKTCKISRGCNDSANNFSNVNDCKAACIFNK